MIQQQSSFHNEEEKGILYLVPTPIGNLEDMTFRAIRLLKEVNIIAAEDTRNTKKLLNYFDIHTPLVSYHEHSKEYVTNNIIQKLQEGQKVAIVSDAGMPTISDPGYDLVVAAIQEQLTVVPLPGANAALTALIASGLLPQPFSFFGFLSRTKKEKKEQLASLNKVTHTFILYESPHRLKESLQMMRKEWGNRGIVLCRELTKKYETFLRGTLDEAIEWSNVSDIRGEFVMIIEGNATATEDTEEQWWQKLSLVDHVQYYIDEKQLSSKEAIKQTSVDRKVAKREVYQAFHGLDN